MYISTGEMYYSYLASGGPHLENELYISSTKMYISTGAAIYIWRPPDRNKHLTS